MEISRKKFKKLLFILINFMLILNISYGESVYRVDSLKIIVQINKDGSADISEQIFYDAYSIKEIYHNIDYNGYGEIENLNIYFGKNGNYQLANEGYDKKIGTYKRINEGEVTKIKLYYPLNEEEAYFMFNYKLQNAITIYNDTAQFCKKLVEKDFENPIENIEILIKLPEEVNQELIKAFWHGHFDEKIDILNEREIRFKIKNYHQEEPIEINILFPKEIIFSQNKNIFKDKNGYEEIIKKEKKLYDDINLKRKIVSHGNVIGNIVFGICLSWIIFVVIFIYKNNGKRYVVKDEEGYFKEISTNFSPAIVGAIVTKNVNPAQLFATLMDLIRRKILLLDGKNGKVLLSLKRDCLLNDLEEYEKFILKWYIEEIGNGEEVFIEEIENSLKNKEKYIIFKKKYDEWKNLLENGLKKVGFRLEEPKSLGITLGFLTGILSIPIGFIFLILFDSSKFIIFPFFISFSLIIYTISVKRYSLEAEKLKIKWLSFKKFLLNYSSFKESKFDSHDIREQYFIYALAMGISKEVLEEYKKVLRKDSEIKRKIYDFRVIENLMNLMEKKEKNFILKLIEDFSGKNFISKK